MLAPLLRKLVLATLLRLLLGELLLPALLCLLLRQLRLALLLREGPRSRLGALLRQRGKAALLGQPLLSQPLEALCALGGKLHRRVLGGRELADQRRLLSGDRRDGGLLLSDGGGCRLLRCRCRLLGGVGRIECSSCLRLVDLREAKRCLPLLQSCVQGRGCGVVVSQLADEGVGSRCRHRSADRHERGAGRLVADHITGEAAT